MSLNIKKTFLLLLILFGITKSAVADYKSVGENFMATSVMALEASFGAYLGYKILRRKIGMVLGSLLIRVPTEIFVSKITPKYQELFDFWMVLEILTPLLLINQELLKNELT